MAEGSRKKRNGEWLGEEAESSTSLQLLTERLQMDKVHDIEDKDLVHGKLANGLSYYVCSSPVPISTVIASLVVKVG